MWQNYISVPSIEEALPYLAQERETARIVAGATDLILELERGVRTGIHTLVDISRIPALDQITIDDDGVFHLGPLVTHNQCAASKLIQERAYPLARASWEVGAPQIRNRATVAGNLITASPANDTIPPLMAFDAQVRLVSMVGERVIPLSEFYTGVRQNVMRPDEMLVDIFFPAMTSTQRGAFIKLGLRKAQAISVVNAAVLLTLDKGLSDSDAIAVEKAVITLGAVAPVIIHAREAEEYLLGKILEERHIVKAAQIASQAAQPIDDLRSSAVYRREMVRICIERALRAIQTGEERSGVPENPVLLADTNSNAALASAVHHQLGTPIVTTINGEEYSFYDGHAKTLLRLLREDAGLIGTKEGCAEGECGACTVYLDGTAVMACLVPAARAHGAQIITIEGLTADSVNKDGHLHPVQDAFIEHGAVQCGYCTPGFIMAAAKLLEERQEPDRDDILTAISGNLCRCTGYYKIIDAIESAAIQLQPQSNQ